MSDEKKETESPRGRTVWDFASEFKQKHGWTLLFVFLLAYGFFKYQDVTTNMQSQLNEAHKELRETSLAIGDLNNRMIANIKGGLDELDELQKRHEQLKNQADAETKKTADAIARQKEAEEATKNAKEATLKAENDLKNFKLKKETEQKLRIAKSGPLKDKVKSLISLLSNVVIDDPDIMNLASEIRQDYLVDPLALFQAVAKDPNVENLQKLKELEGFKYEDIKDIVRENKAGFAAWMLVEEEGDYESTLFGVVRASKKKFSGLVLIKIDDEGRVWYVSLYTHFFLLAHPNIFDWDDYVTTGIAENLMGELDDGPVLKVPSVWPQEKMSMFDFFAYVFMGSAPPQEVKFSVLAGEKPSIKPITLDELRTEVPIVYSKLLGGGMIPVKEIEMMIRKSKTFTAAPMVSISIDKDYSNLGNFRKTIIRTLEAGVMRDSTERKNLAGDRYTELNWGMISAMALHNQFMVDDLYVSPDQLDAYVTCSFRHIVQDNVTMTGMVFQREKAHSQSPWQIIRFREPSGPQDMQQAH